MKKTTYHCVCSYYRYEPNIIPILKLRLTIYNYLAREGTDVNEESVSTIIILTTCRGRERPGGQIWLAGEGFERKEREIEKRERILVRGGIFMKSTISRDWVGLSRNVEEQQSAGPTPLRHSSCWLGQATVLQFKTEQTRPVKERRDRNRSESRPWRRGEDRGKGRERENERTRQR